MGQRKVIIIYMNSYRLTLYISSVVYMLALRGPIQVFSTAVNATVFIYISVTMGQRKVIIIYMNSYQLTLYISSVVYMLASRGPILKLYQKN